MEGNCGHTGLVRISITLAMSTLSLTIFLSATDNTYDVSHAAKGFR